MSATLNDEQHDWTTKFCGVATRGTAQNGDGEATDPGAAAPGGSPGGDAGGDGGDANGTLAGAASTSDPPGDSGVPASPSADAVQLDGGTPIAGAPAQADPAASSVPAQPADLDPAAAPGGTPDGGADGAPAVAVSPSPPHGDCGESAVASTDPVQLVGGAPIAGAPAQPDPAAARPTNDGGAPPVPTSTDPDKLDGGAPIAGAPPQAVPDAPLPPAQPVDPAPTPTDDNSKKLLSGWAAGGASPKSPDPSDQDPAVVAQRQKLADAVKAQREQVAVNPALKTHPPEKDSTGKIVQPGGFQYGGKPSPNPPSLDVAGDQKRSDTNHAIWSELGAKEGGVSSINTWDTAGLTVGGGFAANGGALPSVMTKFLKNDPEAAEALKQVGLTCQDGKFLAVDPQSGKILEGNAAINSIKADPHVLSRLVEVLENPEHAKKFADVEWASIKGAAGAVPKDVLDSWDQNTIVMAAHFVHWTGTPWPTWAGIGPDVTALVREGVKRAHKDKPVGGATIVLAGDTQILLGSANGCGKKAVTGPGPLPEDIDPKDPTSYAGHVFLQQSKDKYWHLPP